MRTIRQASRRQLPLLRTFLPFLPAAVRAVNEADYFTPAVRSAMVQLVMQKCGEAQYSQDVTHHAVRLLDQYCSTQPPSSPIDPSLTVWQETMWTCLSLAVRMQKNWSDLTEHLFDSDQTSIGGCDIKQISQLEWVIATKLEWNLCLPATPSFWLYQLIARALHLVTANVALTDQLLDARNFARAAQYVDIMILFTSHLKYLFMAAVAFYIVYGDLLTHLPTDWTSLTGYSAKVISSEIDMLRPRTTKMQIHDLQLDSDQQRNERHNGDNYIIDFMRQPHYEMGINVLAYDAATASIPHHTIGQERAPCPEGVWPIKREYKRVKRKLLGKVAQGDVVEVVEKNT